MKKKHKIILSYNQAKPLINEADVLLFRGSSIFGYFIGVAGGSTYTHVGLASWVNGDSNTSNGSLECIEFREGAGGRAVNLETQVDESPGLIDVYRPVPVCSEWKFNLEDWTTSLERRSLNARDITRTMRKMTGLPYGWKRVWWIAKYKMLFFRLFTDRKSLEIDTVKDVIYPVCSTAVAYAFNSNGYDLTNNKSDEWTEPADIARSTRLSYLFTLDKSQNSNTIN